MPLVDTLREPQLDLFLGIFDRIRSVADVSVKRNNLDVQLAFPTNAHMLVTVLSEDITRRI